jgi:hypothetical protein
MNPTNLDLRALAEVLADVLVERGLVTSSADAGGRVLDAAAVAHLLGRERQWVYDHANELGAFRYGDGPGPASASICNRSSNGRPSASSCGRLLHEFGVAPRRDPVRSR